MKIQHKLLSTLLLFLSMQKGYSQTQNLSIPIAGDNLWHLVGNCGGRHGYLNYVYSQITANNPSIVKGTLEFINSKNEAIQYNQTMGYQNWNQPQFAIINKGNSSELWIKASSGVTGSTLFIDKSQYVNFGDGTLTDSNLDDNGGTVKYYNKLKDNAHSFTGNVLVLDGNVGIGTDSPSEKLSVNGKIVAKEIVVKLSNSPDWPDYVFKPGYQLPDLLQLEKTIDSIGHLTGIASEKEVQANGIEIGTLNKQLLQKVEELTLLLIREHKTVQRLEKLVDKKYKN